MRISQEYGKIILRIGMSLVFLWFGITQLYDPSSWTAFVPAFLTAMLPAKTIVMLNGSFEVIFGLLLLAGLYLRIASILLGLHLAGIAFSLGYSATAIRDLGLSIATLSIFFNGYDRWCMSSNKNQTPITDEPRNI